MSHPQPNFDWTEKHRAESPREYASRAGMKKMSPVAHSSPVFKEARKAMQGINATDKSSREKSIGRAKLKALKSKKQ